MRLPSPALVVALIALIAAVSGTSYAVGRATSDTINACQDRKTGALAVKQRCAKGEKRVSWNVQGPTGATGATGATRATGATGPTFSFVRSDVYGSTITITSGTTVVSESVDVPTTGRLVVNVTGRIFIGTNGNNDEAMAYCRAWSAPPGGASAPVGQIMASSPALYKTGAPADGVVTLTFGVDVATAGTYLLRVVCTKQHITNTPTLGFDRYDMTGVLTAA